MPAISLCINQPSLRSFIVLCSIPYSVFYSLINKHCGYYYPISLSSPNKHIKRSAQLLVLADQPTDALNAYKILEYHAW